MNASNPAQINEIPSVLPCDDNQPHGYETEHHVTGGSPLKTIAKVIGFMVVFALVVAIKVGVRLAFR